MRGPADLRRERRAAGAKICGRGAGDRAGVGLERGDWALGGNRRDGNPSGATRQLPLHRGAKENGVRLVPPLASSHRNSFSSYSGVPVGLFSEKAIRLFLQNARPSVALRPTKGAKERVGAMPPLCKGRWIGEAETEGLSLLQRIALGGHPLRRDGNPSVRCGGQLLQTLL